MRLSMSPAIRIRWIHFFQFTFKGFCWLIILGSLVDAGDPANIKPRSFHQDLPASVRRYRNTPLPNPVPKSYSNIQHTHRNKKDDLLSAAQTLYDLRGFHIPLGGQEETQQYIRQQNAQQQQHHLRQNPLVFPSFFQPRNSPQQHHQHHLVENAQPQQQYLNIYGDAHAIQDQETRTQAENTPTAASVDFRPSQPDFGQSTTEDAFRPFNPEPLDNSPKSQRQPHNPYIYVYDDPDYEVEVSKSPIGNANSNSQENRKGRLNQVQTTALQQTTPPSLPAQMQYEYFEEDDPNNPNYYSNGQPNNNIPFSGFVDDHSSSGSFIPGQHYTSGPNVEIIPSSERKPPPDARNTVLATLAKPKKKEQKAKSNIEIEPQKLVEQNQSVKGQSHPLYEEIPNRPTYEQDFPPKNQNPHNFPPQYQPPPLIYEQPFNFQPAPTNEREIHNFFNPPPKKARVTEASRPIHIIGGSEGEEYDPQLVQKLNPYIQPDPFQPSQRFRHVNLQTQDHEIILEEIQTTTEIPTTTTTQLPTRSTTAKARTRFGFPPFASRSATASTTTSTTTPAPRIRMSRPRLRSKPTTPTTTTTTSTTQPPPLITTLDPEYYDIDPQYQISDVATYNSVEEQQPDYDFNRQNQRPLYNHEEEIENKKNNLFNQGKFGRGHVQQLPNYFEKDQQSLIGFRQSQTFSNAKVPSPSPTPDQHIYEDTPTLQVKSRLRNPGLRNIQNFRPQFSQTPFIIERHQGPTLQGQNQELQFIPDFSPFPEPPRQQTFFQQIPRGRKQPPGPHRIHHGHTRIGGKPLYITGKMLEKEGGLYAGYEILPQHHMYGYGPPPFIPIPSSPSPSVEPTRQTPRRTPETFLRQRDKDQRQGHLQVRQHQTQIVRRPHPTQQAFREPESITNVIPATVESEVEIPVQKIRGRLRQINTERRRKPKTEVIPDQQFVRSRFEEVEIPQTTPAQEREIRTRYSPKPLIIEEYRATTSATPPTARETIPPSLEIELPLAPKPNPLKRRPLTRIRVTGPLSTASTTPILEAVENPTSKPSRNLRPRPRVMRPSKLLTGHSSESTSHTSSRVDRKPTQAPGKYSSKYREEGIQFITPAPTEPTNTGEDVPESEIILPPIPTFLVKPRPIVKKKKPKQPTPPPQTTTAEAPSTQNSEIFLPPIPTLSPRDVVSNRKPARRIPPGSASDRLKALTERRRKLFKPKIHSAPPNSDEFEDQEPNASDQVQSKREIRVGNKHSVFGRNKFGFQSKFNPKNGSKESNETNSEEVAAVVGITTPTPTTSTSTPKSSTEFHLLWEEVGRTSLSTLHPLSSSTTEKGISVPIIEFNSNIRDDENPIPTPESPFNLFRISNESPTLPIEAQFFQSWPILSSATLFKSEFKL